MRTLSAALLVAVTFTSGCQRSGPPAPPPGAGATQAPADTATRAPDTDEAASVVRAYYQAINERRYGDAYRLWASDGAASGKSLEAFQDGFGSTASVDVVLGTPGPIGAAAGSRYIEIPVRITAIATDGGREAFVGAYTLRRSVVDGATLEQRAWRIYSAQIRRER
ncbi:MAG TPA: hypothetical protein VJY35_08260 [Candidatus Eisenbacteria bacterium]|nr:hypothetical protein [Candidatus Eisenbacteria bacterium]